MTNQEVVNWVSVLNFLQVNKSQYRNNKHLVQFVKNNGIYNVHNI
jgi:hypothetical protein